MLEKEKFFFLFKLIFRVMATSDLKVLTLEKQDFWFAFGSGPESMGS
jgi:hypothetical protein